MKRVLVISYYYPPLADVGGNRTVRFVTHMSKYGWNPHVLTIMNPDRNYCLLGNVDVPQDVKVTRAVSLFNFYSAIGKINGVVQRIGERIPLLKPRHDLQDLFYIPDPIPGWLLCAYFSARRLLNRNIFDLIYASIKPLGGALLAMKLSRETSLPFIVDARDPISCKVFKNRDPKTLRERFSYKYENKIINNCKKYIITSKTTERAYKSVYPGYRHKFRVIYNGFDHVNNVVPMNAQEEKFRIIYLGSYYHSYLDPAPFFHALKEWIDENKTIRNNIVFRYLGENGYWIEKIKEKYALQNIFKVLGRRNRDEMMGYVRTSDLFFIRNPYPTNIGAKLFDGLAVKIPILSTFTHPEVEFLIRKYADRYTIMYDESIFGIKEALKKYYCEDTCRAARPFNQEFIDDFSADKLTAKLCAIFNETVSKKPKKARFPMMNK